LAKGLKEIVSNKAVVRHRWIATARRSSVEREDGPVGERKEEREEKRGWERSCVLERVADKGILASTGGRKRE
jgi:hypothetical protein